MQVLRSTVLGFLVASTAGLAFGSWNLEPLASAYLLPGIVVGSVLVPLLPTTLVYAIEPEGGAVAFIKVALACAVGFWSTAIGVLHWRRVRSNRAKVPGASV